MKLRFSIAMLLIAMTVVAIFVSQASYLISAILWLMVPLPTATFLFWVRKLLEDVEANTSWKVFDRLLAVGLAGSLLCTLLLMTLAVAYTPSHVTHDDEFEIYAILRN